MHGPSSAASTPYLCPNVFWEANKIYSALIYEDHPIHHSSAWPNCPAQAGLACSGSGTVSEEVHLAPAPLLHARHSGVPTCPPVSTAVDWAAATPGSVPEVWRGSWCPCEAACCTQSSSKLQMSTLQ